MNRLDTNEVAALQSPMIATIAAQHNTDDKQLLAQMVLRTVSTTGAVYVDDKENPTSLVYLILGTFGMLAEASCIVAASESASGKYSTHFMAAKQFAKERMCKSIIVGDFSGSGQEALKEKLASPKNVNIQVQTL